METKLNHCVLSEQNDKNAKKTLTVPFSIRALKME